ncbi:flagellar hook-basal body complex protein FliE [Trichloromonas sp.]|uniref:flagellar hook-basal body complex protein FliE n=1 Tax=Trichloromonas sp. TaxID=3069249 RepID=UPI002A458DBE|nr:flagellar hook-basal body complex protein FliE [Trichloromonas sp.]
MSDITLLSHLRQISTPPAPSGAPAQGGNGGFAKALGEALDSVNSAQAEADLAVEQLQTGESRNLHEIMIAMEKADISLKLAVQMRNKVLEAYQEIMRMQV